MGLGNLDLRQMRIAASATLVAMIIIYIATFAISSPGWPLILLRAAAGAGIVGALADWFAVVALFRHPLGLPIPHTALLPRNQERVAENVGRFIEDHFLKTEPIVEKLRESRLSARALDWLLSEQHVDTIVATVLRGAGAVLNGKTPPLLAENLVSLLRSATSEATNSDRIAREVSELLKQGLHGDALTEIIEFLSVTVKEKRSTVRHLVRENSRWWIASRIDRNASEMIVNGLLSVLEELSNPESDLRIEFEDAADIALQKGDTIARLRSVIAKSLESYLASERFEAGGAAAVDSLKSHLAAFLQGEDFADFLKGALRSLAEDLSQNPDTQARVDAEVAAFVGSILPMMRPHLGGFITQTIKDWDPDMLVELFEKEAGRDLQFIRINGALLGFIIGGGLFAVEHALG